METPPPSEAPDELTDYSTPVPPKPRRPEDVPPADLEELRKGFAAVAESDKLDKETSLTILRLHHGYESLLLHERHLRRREVEALQQKLERSHLQQELERLARRKTLEEVVHAPPPPAVVRRFGGAR